MSVLQKVTRKYSNKMNRICCENCTYFLSSYKNQTIQSGVEIRKSFDLSVIVKYSYHFQGGGQNKIAVGILMPCFHKLQRDREITRSKQHLAYCKYINEKASI